MYVRHPYITPHPRGPPPPGQPHYPPPHLPLLALLPRRDQIYTEEVSSMCLVFMRSEAVSVCLSVYLPLTEPHILWSSHARLARPACLMSGTEIDDTVRMRGAREEKTIATLAGWLALLHSGVMNSLLLLAVPSRTPSNYLPFQTVFIFICYSSHIDQ